MKAALFIAVEKYSDKHFGEVKYAAADARDFAAVLEQHGFAPADRETLTSDQATKTSLESVIRTMRKRLTADDTLYFYYAGHGFSKLDGSNYLACFDTRSVDPEETSIGLAWLLDQFKQFPCQQIVLFLDACSSGLPTSDAWRGSYGEMGEVELTEYFTSSEHALCLAACGSGEHSHSSTPLQHGLWAYHLIQAFDGRVPTALQGQSLTAASLQSYLQAAVPAALRKIAPQATQTPCLYGPTNTDVPLADLQDICAQRKAAQHPQAGQVKDSILLAESIDFVNRLAGFKKSLGHTAPSRHGSSAQAFINTLAAPEIDAEVEQVRAALKQAFRFKRLELSVDNHGDGAATITTPYFNYNVRVEQSPHDPGSVLWRRFVDAIVDPDQVLSPAFGTVFAHTFDTVELSLHAGVDLNELIDAIEAFDSDDIAVAYDQNEDITSCLITIRGNAASIKVTKDTFSVVHPKTTAPKLLLQSLFDIQLALTQQHHGLGLPFESAT